MVPVNVGNQNEVGLGQSSELHGLHGIKIDGFSARLDQGAGVVERSNFDRAGRGGKGLRLVRGIGGWTRFRALVCLLLLGAVSVFTWITLVLVPNRISTDRLQLFAWFALLALFGAVLKGSRSPNLTRISAGFSVFSLMQFSALAGRTVAFLHRNAGQYVAWSYVPAVGYLAIVIFWLITLRKESERILLPSELAS